MRAILVAAVAAFALASAASAAAPSAGPYKFDANGKCHAANGALVPNKMCHDQPPHPVCKAGVTKACGKGCIPVANTCHK